MTVKCAENEAPDTEIVYAQMESYQDEKSGVNWPGGDETWDDDGAELEHLKVRSQDLGEIAGMDVQACREEQGRSLYSSPWR